MSRDGGADDSKAAARVGRCAGAAASAMRVALVAGETSGDLLGAGLVREIAARARGATFEGIAGPRMCREGASTLYAMESISIMGLDGLVNNLRHILSIRNALFERFADTKPDVFVGIDVPDFNLGLEYRLRRAGIPTVHYVSPTVWAWRRYRLRKIRRAVNHMLTLFPFEARFYEERGIPVTFVGHPLADRIELLDRSEARRRLGIATAGPIVALLPGSRSSEISRLGGLFVETALLLGDVVPGLRFVLPCAGAHIRDGLHHLVAEAGMEDRITLIDGNAQVALQAADVALLASGTAALEAALVATPMVVAYRVSPLSYHVVKWFTTVSHYSMPNHLLDTPVVPEFIQKDATAPRLAAAVREFLDDAARRECMRSRLSGIRESLAVGADRRAAQVVLDVAGRVH